MPISRFTSASRPAPCLEESVFVEILRTGEGLSQTPAHLLKEHDLTTNQYNVLRILRGAPEGLLCGEIASRMISRDPDITRLLDRLEARGLIGRSRPDQDRRRVLARIAPGGLAVLKGLDGAICGIHRRQLGHLGAKRLAQLSRLLAICRNEAG